MSRSWRSIVVIVFLLTSIPTMGASCVPLWVLADRECRHARAAGTEPTTDARFLRDVGVAGTIVFGTAIGLMLLYVLYFMRAGGGRLQ